MKQQESVQVCVAHHHEIRSAHGQYLHRLENATCHDVVANHRRAWIVHVLENHHETGNVHDVVACPHHPHQCHQ
eukprot:12906564-Prorocentrum_lima.AAC.1